MQDDARSHGLWEASAPPGPAAQALAERISVDVVVVGAGFTGLSAALHLAEGGASVAVLDAIEVGFGGSGRNVGLVNAGMWVMPEALPGALVRLLDAKETAQRTGTHWIGMTPNALPRFHRLARNTISFSGYNGRGIATGTVFGRELARLVLGQTSEEDLPLPVSRIEPVSLRPVREAYDEAGAQVAHLPGARR